jgi:hypothetical protein
MINFQTMFFHFIPIVFNIVFSGDLLVNTTKPALDCTSKVTSFSKDCNVAYVQLKAFAGTNVNCHTGDMLQWTLLVDIDGDNKIEYEYSSSLDSFDDDIHTDSNGNGIADAYLRPTRDSQSINLPGHYIARSNAVHTATWKVIDACGFETTCSSTFTTKDNEAPSIICVNKSSVIINESMAELWAKDFIKDAYDNCTTMDSLIYTFGEYHPVLSRINSQEHYFKGKGIDATIEEYNAGEAQRWNPKFKSSAMFFFPLGQRHVMITVWDRALNTSHCEVHLTDLLVGENPFLQYLGFISNITVDSLIKNGPDDITSKVITQFLSNFSFNKYQMVQKLWQLSPGWKVYCIKHQFIYLDYKTVFEFLINDLKDTTQMKSLVEKLMIIKYRENLDNTDVKYIVELSQTLAMTNLISQKKALAYLLNYDLYVGNEVKYKQTKDINIIYAKNLLTYYADTEDTDLLDVAFGTLIESKIDTAFINKILPEIETLAAVKKTYIYYDILSYCYYRIGNQELAYQLSAKARQYSKIQAYPGRLVYLNAYRAVLKN